ncbi:MAG TPA: hypothetical protein VH374_01015 [Polyangia bacterium]|nr:hypothetical protein [Polyangia bacterium]
MNAKKSIERLRKSSILETLGLAKKNSTGAAFVGTISILGLGVMTGLGLGLLLAPRSGQATRRELERRIKRSAWRAVGRAQDLLESTQMAGA